MKKYFAEFFGTFWLVFGGCGSAVLAAGIPELGIGYAGVSLAFGLTVLTMVLKTTKTKKTKEIGIWRNFTDVSWRELLKTGALRCIAPFFILRERKLRKNQIFG